MGQKISPISNRLSLTKDWGSKWFGRKRDLANFLHEDLKIRGIVKEKLRSAGLERVVIERGSGEIRIKIFSSRPGVIIGRSGSGAGELTEILHQTLGKKVDIKIIEVRKPDLSAALQAENIAYQLEKRVSFRKAIGMVMDKIKAAGATGVKIIVAGRLGGAEIARRETFNFGSVPLSTFRSKIDFAKDVAKTKFGVVGVKVWIYKK